MEEPTTPADAAPEAAEAEPTTFDADYVKSLRAEAAKYRTEAKANAEAAARLREIEDAQKSEAQRAQEALAEAQREAETARLEALRLRVGVSAGLPPEAISRLQGSTEDEIAADAAKLAELLKPAAPPVAGKPSPTLQSGAVPPEAQTPTDLNEWMRRSLSR
jgi:hypothetical protein